MDRRRAFTLIELLVVISVIVILATILVSGYSIVRKKAMVSVAATTIDNLKAAIKAYETEEGYYPGYTPNPAIKSKNDPLALFQALYNPREYGGGRSSPYFDVKRRDIRIKTQEREDPFIPLTQAKDDEIDNPSHPNFMRKVFTDPWGHSFRYYEWASRKADASRRKVAADGFVAKNKHSFDIYSMGPDGIDDKGENGTKRPGPDGKMKTTDDINNWD